MKAVSIKNVDIPPPPCHVAIIMDGNGRWAQARNLPRTAGHQRGAESVRRCVEGAIEQGIDYLTLYGFSSENWKRPLEEIKELMGLLRFYLKNEVRKLNREGVRFQVIGDRAKLADDIVSLIDDAESETASNTRLVLTIALSYGSRAEIATAAQRIASQVSDGTLAIEDIDEHVLGQNLSTANMPDPDLLIRTSGEQRISNFLLWQLAYSEFIFVDKLWPDFGQTDLQDAVQEYHRRERRYGATGG
ncbi:MAG: isoprenyl transferase [Rhodospirillaceae bacterium]|nr:isoprenyl transferase [Rhodospirillaceae bacterium]